jgi:tetratricopeptide (TPR) repeat protein
LKAFHFFFLPLIAGLYACGERHKVVPVITSPDYKKGMSLLNQQSDSAFYYFNKVATSSKDSLQIALAYNHMADIQSDAGDYYGSQESLLTSLKYLNEQKERDHLCLTADYNELGNTSLNLKNYNAAIDFYDLALKFSKSESFKAIALNGKAVTYQKMRQYNQAIPIYQLIIDQSRKNKKEYARIVSNLAKTRWLQDPRYRAAPDLLMALQIRKNEKDEWGLNASYAHLSDFYSHSRPDSALIYAGKMYAIAQKLTSPDDELEALQKLILLSPPKDLKLYFTQYLHLSDSLQTTRNAAKNQFALIRYDAQKNKADNLRLQQDNTENKVEIIQQQIIIYSAAIVFVIIVGFLVAWSRRRKQKMEWESREYRLKTSQKVHDVVANGLYRMMTKIEHNENIEKEQLLDEIEDLYEQSRDISYEQSERLGQEFQTTIAELLTSFAGPTTKILVLGNHKDLWDKVNCRIKKVLDPILLELMINMKKHSGARNVALRFDREGEHIKIQYTDDGVGFAPHWRYGNGLTNTGNRIRDIGGRIIFDHDTPKGLKIQIYLPIA